MFGIGAAREQRESEYFFKQTYRQMPSLAIELWHPLPGEAMDTIISIRKSLDKCEAALLRENPALAEKVEAAKTADNKQSTQADESSKPA